MAVCRFFVRYIVEGYFKGNGFYINVINSPHISSPKHSPLLPSQQKRISPICVCRRGASAPCPMYFVNFIKYSEYITYVRRKAKRHNGHRQDVEWQEVDAPPTSEPCTVRPRCGNLVRHDPHRHIMILQYVAPSIR